MIDILRPVLETEVHHLPQIFCGIAWFTGLVLMGVTNLLEQ